MNVPTFRSLLSRGWHSYSSLWPHTVISQMSPRASCEFPLALRRCSCLGAETKGGHVQFTPKHPMHHVPSPTHPSSHICLCTPMSVIYSNRLVSHFLFSFLICYLLYHSTLLSLCVPGLTPNLASTVSTVYKGNTSNSPPAQPYPLASALLCSVSPVAPVSVPVGTIPISLLFNLDKNLSCSMWEINIQ